MRVLTSTFCHPHFTICILSSAFFHPPSAAISRHPVLTLQRPSAKRDCRHLLLHNDRVWSRETRLSSYNIWWCCVTTVWNNASNQRGQTAWLMHLGTRNPGRGCWSLRKPASTEPGPDRTGPDNGSDHGSDHEPDHGPDHGSDHGSDHRKKNKVLKEDKSKKKIKSFIK